MPTLHALLVGISRYPIKSHVLKGCVNDVRRVYLYLEAYCRQMGFGFRPLLLTDSAATRQDVLDGFGHFQSAGADDCCLFHFSGHGARWRAPEAFRHLTRDGHIESLVCWDSRLPGGHDLMDKELSYLVWQASQKTKRPVLTILDSCHAGDMRSITEQKHDQQLDVVGVRSLPGAPARETSGLRDTDDVSRWADCALPVEQFHGVEHYARSADGRLSPTEGSRVHFGAARDVEYAKEILVGGPSAHLLPMGAFTHSLLETLGHTGPLITYADLLQQVNVRIRQNVAEQSAQLRATHAGDRNLGFLFSDLEAGRPALMVSWDKGANGWFVNAGALHGISDGDPGSRTVLEITGDASSRQVVVEGVEPARSLVAGMDGCDTRRSYTARIRQRAVPKLALAFAPGSDPAAVAVLRQAVQDRAPDTIRLCESPSESNYLIHAGGAGYFLSGLHDDRALFRQETGCTEATAADFLQKLEHVSSWHQVLALHCADTEIGDDEIRIELFRLSEARTVGDMDNDVPVEAVDWPEGPGVFRYFREGDPQKKIEPLQPAFQLRIRNTGHRTLWVGMLYLDAQFGVTDRLFTGKALVPGAEAWAEDIPDNSPYRFRTIPLQIEDAAERTADEFLKILISTEELNTGWFNQDSLPVESERDRDRTATRGPVYRSSRKQPREKDWAAKTVWLRLERESGGSV